MMSGIVQALDVAGLWLVDAVVRVTIDGALVALPVWLACRFVTTVSASVRAWLWWGVALKLLLSLTGAPSLPIPVLPASLTPSTPLTTVVSRGPGASAPGLAPVGESRPALTPALSPPDFATATSGTQPRSQTPTSAAWVALRIATVMWALVVIAHLALLVLDAQRLRRLLRRATRPSPAIENEHEDLAKDLGLRRVPALRESPEVTAPQVVGLLRPTVLLPPASATPMSAHERTMVLCHELAHVRRGDLILGWIPALAARVLAWHPLARLAAREYALAREAACDALVLRTLDTAPRDYGRLLVRLGVHAPAVRVAAAGTSPTAHLLRRRLHMLQHASLSPRALTGVALTAAVLALVPLRLVGAPAIDADAPRTPDARATVTAPSSPQSSDVSEPAEPGQRERKAPLRDVEREGRAWIYLYADSNSSTMNGDTDDLKLARRLRGSGNGAFFLYRRGDDIFTIDDRATLERIEAIFEPQHKLGEQQGELGERQGKLGEEQGKLGEQQGRLGERQGRLGSEQGEIGLRHAELSARMAEANVRQQRAAIERLREPSRDRETREHAETESRAQIREIERQMSELDRKIHEITERQEGLGREQEALGREQEKLGERQEALGAEQEKLGELQEEAGRQAERALNELIERAIADGVAKRVK
jgi:bla regulator protein blaR1